MANYGIGVEDVLKPKGDFALIEGEDIKDVLLVVNSLEVPLPSTTLKDGLLCWNIEHQSFYKYNSNASMWGQISFGVSEHENGIIIQSGKAGLGGELVRPTTIDADNNSFGFVNLENFAIQNSGTHQWLINDTGFEWSSSPTGMYFIWKPTQFSVKNSGNTSFEFDNVTITANNSLSITSLFNFSITSLDFKNAIHKPTSQMANANIPDWQNVLEAIEKKHYVSFGQKNWVGSNVILKKNDVADLIFHTTSKLTRLRSVTIQIGEIGAGEIGKSITINLYRINGSVWNETTDEPTLSYIQNGTLIHSMTTPVAGSNNQGRLWQRIYENLNISIPIYSRVFAIITINETSSLNNLSVQLELEEI